MAYGAVRSTGGTIGPYAALARHGCNGPSLAGRPVAWPGAPTIVPHTCTIAHMRIYRWAGRHMRIYAWTHKWVGEAGEALKEMCDGRCRKIGRRYKGRFMYDVDV